MTRELKVDCLLMSGRETRRLHHYEMACVEGKTNTRHAACHSRSIGKSKKGEREGSGVEWSEVALFV